TVSIIFLPRSCSSTARSNDSVHEEFMAKTATRSVELEPIDRLEEKLKALVTMVERIKGEQARAADENQRLSRELDSMRAVLAALNVADELFRCREATKARDGELAERTEELERMLDRLLMA